MAIRAFLSFVEEDLELVNLFRGQARLERSDLEFHDYSTKEPFDGVNALMGVCLYGDGRLKHCPAPHPSDV